MLKLGTQNISALYLGGQGIKKAYLGQELVFGSGPAPIATYTITASIDPAGSGTVTGAGKYQAGETVTIKAVPGDGYKFTGWQENGQTVSGSETYSFTAAADRTLTAVFEEAKVSRLPEGYTEVEYIQSDSASKHFINTGVGQSSSLSIVIDFEPLVAPTSTARHIVYSSYYNSSTKTYNFYFAGFSSKGVGARMGATTASSPIPAIVDSNTALRRMVLKMDASTATASVDNGDPISVLLTSKSFHSSTVIYLLGNMAATATTTYLSAKLYSCQISNSSGLKRDFVPCINPSGVAGLYDLVNGKFYGSGSSTAFVAGPAV